MDRMVKVISQIDHVIRPDPDPVRASEKPFTPGKQQCPSRVENSNRVVATIENEDSVFRVRGHGGHFFDVPVDRPFGPIGNWSITEFAGRGQKPWFGIDHDRPLRWLIFSKTLMAVPNAARPERNVSVCPSASTDSDSRSLIEVFDQIVTQIVTRVYRNAFDGVSATEFVKGGFVPLHRFEIRLTDIFRLC